MTDKKIPMLTLAQFRASRTYVPNLAKIKGIDGPDKQPGYLYLGALYIECVTKEWLQQADKGAFCLTVSNSSKLTSDLAPLERDLYDFAIGEGYCSAPIKDPGRFFDLDSELLNSALDAAVLVIQNHLGVTDGGPASMFFSGDNRDQFDDIMRDYAKSEQHYAGDDLEPPTLDELAQLAKFAVPRNDDEWGSERQIKAQNFFFERIEAFGIDASRWETAKMTAEEMVDEAMTMARDPQTVLAPLPIPAPKAVVTLPDPQRVADAFVAVLWSWADDQPGVWQAMLDNNAKEKPGSKVCHSHDWCDANMAMDAALRSFGLGSLMTGDWVTNNQDMTDLWNKAWELAKPRLTANG
ncbi:MAG TPA: hypothetical protein VJM79_10075 [Rhizorhapis sp.]|nr:hypothetical protein [Rhizorhapis sp.]